MHEEHVGARAVRDRMVGFWNEHADGYAVGAGGGITTATEHAAWLDALRGVLTSAPSDVLDCGTGPGVMAMLAAELGHRVVGIDLAERMLAVARATPAPPSSSVAPRFERGDAADPPFAPGSFDVVLSRYVFWTMVDPSGALANWLRLLRPGGRLVAFDIYWWVREMRDDPNWRGFEQYRANGTAYATMAGLEPPLRTVDTLDEIADLVVRAGFQAVDIRRLTELETQLDEVMQRVPVELGGPYPIHLLTGLKPAGDAVG